MTSLHIFGWPRSVRDTIMKRPDVHLVDTLPELRETVHLLDPMSEKEFRNVLSNDTFENIVLSHGYDADGTVHAAEIVCLPSSSVPPTLYHFRTWSRQKKEESEPLWLAEAEGYMDPVPPPPPTILELCTEFRDEQNALLFTLKGIFPPDVFNSLMSRNNTFLPFVTEDDQSVTMTRVGKEICIEQYCIHLSSWSADTRSYQVTQRFTRTLFPQRVSISRMHYLRRKQFERR